MKCGSAVNVGAILVTVIVLVLTTITSTRMYTQEIVINAFEIKTLLQLRYMVLVKLPAKK